MSPWERTILDYRAAHERTTVVLVCGGRDYTDAHAFNHFMDKMLTAFREIHLNDTIAIVHGGARGADTLADRWANSRGIPVVACPAEWDKHKKAAGVIRNAEMLKNWTPAIVVAFPGGRGTAHMVSIARKAGVRVQEVKA